MGLLLGLAALLPAVGSSGDAATAFEAQLLPWLEEAIDSAGLRHLLRYPDLPLAQQLAVRSGPHGHALHARVGFEAGESILPIPASRLLRDRSTGQAALSWSLAKHRQQPGEHSRLAPYFAVLPDHHPERPAHWGAELLREHLQGSGFTEYVDEREEGVRSDYEALQQRGRRGPSWEQYRWAHDTVATRAMAADSGGKNAPAARRDTDQAATRDADTDARSALAWCLNPEPRPRDDPGAEVVSSRPPAVVTGVVDRCLATKESLQLVEMGLHHPQGPTRGDYHVD